ncbi:MAG: septation protein A [Pseudomonadota bacterium]|nr:septation protein A [Pseudomonadota bacterium]
MKFFLDFLPVLLFFGSFKLADANADAAARFATEHLGFAVSGGVVGPVEAPVLLATVVVIIATLVQILVLLAMRRKIDTMLWVTFVLVTVLGGATVWFHDATFIKWKPSALYWVMAIVFWLSDAIFHKNLLKAMVGEQADLPELVWRRLNLAWAAFFALMGVLNLYVAYNYSTSTWASFKVFGLSGLMLLFMIGQALAVARYVKVADARDADAARPPISGDGT